MEYWLERVEEANEEFNSNPPNIVQHLIIATGHWLVLATGNADAVGHTMNKLLFNLRKWGDLHEDPSSWVENWEDSGGEAAHESARGGEIELLAAFGRFGVFLPGRSTDFDIETRDGRIEFIRDRISKGRAFYDAIPVAWSDKTPEMAEELTILENIVLAAEGRFNVDTGGKVSAEQISAMTRLGIRSVKNLLLPASTSGLRPDAEGFVAANLVSEWLSSRSDYKTSIWMDPPSAAGEQPEIVAAVENASYDEVLFVPVAADGTHFDPKTCHRNAGYQIGSKGDERYIDDFRQALDELSRMKKPSWRRPNANGNWGIVQSVSWARKSSEELGLSR